MSEQFREKTLQEVFFSRPSTADVREKELKNALYENAVGYDYEERTIEAGKDGPRTTRTIRRHMPSDTKIATDILVLLKCGKW